MGRGAVSDVAATPRAITSRLVFANYDSTCPRKSHRVAHHRSRQAQGRYFSLGLTAHGSDPVVQIRVIRRPAHNRNSCPPHISVATASNCKHPPRSARCTTSYVDWDDNWDDKRTRLDTSEGTGARSTLRGHSDPAARRSLPRVRCHRLSGSAAQRA